MKTKVILTLLFIMTLMMESQAFTVVIQGGSRNNKFNYVRASNQSLICRGSGFISCPLDLIAQIKNLRIANPAECIDQVSKAWEEGKTTGEMKTVDGIPVSWKTDDKDLIIQFDVETGQVEEEVIFEKSEESDGK